MSIIYDALQKIQHHREKQVDDIYPVTKIRYMLWAVEALFVVAVCISIVCIVVFHSHGTKKSMANAVTQTTVATTSSVTPVMNHPIISTPSVKIALSQTKIPMITPLTTKPVMVAEKSEQTSEPFHYVLRRPEETGPKTIVFPKATPEKPALFPKKDQPKVIIAPKVEPKVTVTVSKVEPDMMPAATIPSAAPAVPDIKPVPLVNDTVYRTHHILSGVFLSQQERMAIINNQTFHVGDVVDGMKIVRIDLNKVTLQKDTQRLVLEVAI